jgi:hypothetical protein
MLSDGIVTFPEPPALATTAARRIRPRMDIPLFHEMLLLAGRE